MEIINKNIRHLREQAGWTQKELAAKLDVKPPVVGAYEEFRAIPPIPIAIRLADLFEVSLDTLVRTDLGKGLKKKSNLEKFLRGKDVLAITVDSKEKENIELVNHKASAGYLAAYHDTDFIRELPRLSLPFLPGNRTHRAFEITGDSMLPVSSGSIIVGEFTDDLTALKNGDCCIIITRDEGIVYKRVYNFLKESGKLLLVSDNPIYQPYAIDAKDILQVWKKKKIITEEPDRNSETLSGNALAKMVLQLNQELARLKK